MTVKAGVGVSSHRNPELAGQEAAEAALKQAGLTTCDFVMMFSTVGYDQSTIVKAVRKATGGAPLSGCSGEGVIAQQVGNESSHGVTVLVWKSDEITFRSVKSVGLQADAVAVGKDVATKLGTVPDDAMALFVFGDGLSFSFSKFSKGFAEASPVKKELPLVGGTAGDNFTLTKTYQYHDDDVFSDGVSAVLLSGKGRFAVDVSHGCVPIGAERTVTKAEGNVILEIDDKPALSVLNEYLTEEEIKNFNLSTVSLCLGFKAPEEVAQHQDDDFIIRGILGKDEAKGTIAIYTEVETGTKVWMTRRDPDKMASGIDRVVNRIQQKLGGRSPEAVIHFECLGRGKNMFREEDKMRLLNHLQNSLAADKPWVGFYCYGEIAPVGPNNFFHNYTSVLAAIA